MKKPLFFLMTLVLLFSFALTASAANSITNRLKGRLLLQVEQGGAIWYVDINGIRHNVRWNNLMDLFTRLALGITDKDLAEVGNVETANWQTYNAEPYAIKYNQNAYKFSIKYPSDWRPREEDHITGIDVSFLSPDYQISEYGMDEITLKGGRFWIHTISNQTVTDLKSWFDSYFYDPMAKQIMFQSQPISVMIGDGNKVSGLEFKDDGIYGKLFAVGDNVYDCRIFFQKEEVSQKYLEIFNQILSTFKFLE